MKEEVTESERCKLVLNAVFNWEPMEVYQKRCDMTTLRFLFFIFYLYARESSVAAVQSWRDHGRNNFTVELLDRNGRIEAIFLSAGNVVRQRLLMCCFTDSVWSRWTARYVTVLWKGMLLPAMPADSQPTELTRINEPKSIISVFLS